ncbi:ABC transporter substrate-binding protein [Streptomyces zagrosensis]|uniref:Iron complex transport system substrate-binding protein n=1 Tax=Streptomyces zagrosensis TaxID=1042984 RepID=A0A7W9QCN8_9ACTN|nr:ABC transporter substrate-binding protein [Streptomyces zagrosensis]MBB5937479.1 iron complex transport system substrate-binding protein [Streptomyces zagrosensis]
MITSRTASSSASPMGRRSLLAIGGALGAGALITACGKDKKDASGTDDATSGSGERKGPWTYRDDRGVTAKADKTPKNIVAYSGTAAALHDFGITCAGVFGPTRQKNGKPDVLAGDLNVDKVTIIGEAWGEFSIEKYAALQPDLLVTNMYAKGDLWFVPEESRKKILDLSPNVVGLTVARTSLLSVVQRYAALAESLGADLKAKQVTDAKARFEQASETLRQAAKGKRGLKVLATSASADLLYASDPKAYADLTYFKDLGVEVITPKKVSGEGFFENLSWENADTYDADLILLDNRSQALQPNDLKAKPTWQRLPAVKAGQVVPWASEPRFSYAGFAPHVEALAKAIQDAKKVA